jgi:manganese transport protein
MEKKNLYQRILIGLSAIGPGLFLIGYNIGTGSITTMAKTGAEHGMTLTWALVLSCIFTYILMVAYGKTTIVSGQTALSTIKSGLTYGKVLAIYILIALVVGELLALMGIFGIVTDLIREASRLLFGGEGWNTLGITVVLVVGLYTLLWFGKYQVFEKFLIYLVILMGLCFIVVFYHAQTQCFFHCRGTGAQHSENGGHPPPDCRHHRHHLFSRSIHHEKHRGG